MNFNYLKYINNALWKLSLIKYVKYVFNICIAHTCIATKTSHKNQRSCKIRYTRIAIICLFAVSFEEVIKFTQLVLQIVLVCLLELWIFKNRISHPSPIDGPFGPFLSTINGLTTHSLSQKPGNHTKVFLLKDPSH